MSTDIAVVVLDPTDPDYPVGATIPMPVWLGSSSSVDQETGPFRVIGWGEDCAPLDRTTGNCTPVSAFRQGESNRVDLWKDVCGFGDKGFCTNVDIWRHSGDITNTADPSWEIGAGLGDSGGPLTREVRGRRRVVGVFSNTARGYGEIDTENDEGVYWAPTGSTPVTAAFLASYIRPVAFDLRDIGIFAGGTVDINDRAK